jgi:hypothetical protein
MKLGNGSLPRLIKAIDAAFYRNRSYRYKTSIYVYCRSAILAEMKASANHLIAIYIDNQVTETDRECRTHCKTNVQ